MGKMSWIAYLAESGNKKELMEEVSGIASMTGKTSTEVADEFIKAAKTIKENKDNNYYKHKPKAKSWIVALQMIFLQLMI